MGSFSEYVSVSWAKVFPLPDGVSTKIAAAGLTQGARPKHLSLPLACKLTYLNTQAPPH